MTIKAVLLDTANNIQTDLSRFISEYPQLPDEDRMEFSRKILSQLRDFFQIQKVVFDETSRTDSSLSSQYAPYRSAEEEIWEIHEHTIMIHVDEPDGQYLEQLERLRKAFQVFTRQEYNDLIANVCETLPEDADARILKKVQKEPEVSFSR